MAITIIGEAAAGSILITANEAIRMSTDLVDDVNPKAKGTELSRELGRLQTQIEAKHIRAVAHDGKNPLYTTVDLRIPESEIE